MDQIMSQIQIQDASPYVSAPTSPSGCSLDNMHFYSAPSSPMRRIGNAYGYESETQNTNIGVNSDSDEFEFETSHNFARGSEFESSLKFKRRMDDERKQEKQKQPERGDSFSQMAFADELFSNGQVLPLKLPPRLQYGSVATSPRSPSSVLRIPFAHRNTWNDNFDPFAVALEKVREEKKGRKIVHRRTRSQSPFRTTTTSQPMQQIGPKPNELMAESKGSVYARWARRESMGRKETTKLGTSPKVPNKPNGLSFRLRGRTMKVGQEGPMKPTFSTPPGPTNGEESEGECSGSGESRMQKVKGLLLRYASFGKENNVWKPSYFKRLSFKFKGSSHQGNGMKKVCGESKTAVVQYKPKLTLCLGYGMESPRN